MKKSLFRDQRPHRREPHRTQCTCVMRVSPSLVSRVSSVCLERRPWRRPSIGIPSFMSATASSACAENGIGKSKMWPSTMQTSLVRSVAGAAGSSLAGPEVVGGRQMAQPQPPGGGGRSRSRSRTPETVRRTRRAVRGPPREQPPSSPHVATCIGGRVPCRNSHLIVSQSARH
jgi:hypothetical protein